MMLAALQPRFIKLTDPNVGGQFSTVNNIYEADGIIFLCPKCFARNGGERGTHSVICWRPHVSPDIQPKPGRWEFEGEGLGDLTLRAGSSSILLMGGCNWHGYIEQGSVRSV